VTARTAVAHPNIAFIKYWGNRDAALRLPANSSLSMNLAELETKTTVEFDSALAEDSLMLNGRSAAPAQTKRVSNFLDLVRGQAKLSSKARVESENNFPSGAGIASSSSAFAALALAASASAGLQLDESALSVLARRGSGSASRSVPPGFVVWHAADKDAGSFSESIAEASHWVLVDCIAIVSEEHKAVGSSEGHGLANTSPLQIARVAGAADRLDRCKGALLAKDFASFAEIVELDCHLMHAVMMTSRPALHYWQPASLAVMDAVRAWRTEGASVCYTLDAGPNVHVLTLSSEADETAEKLSQIAGVLRVLRATPGGAARLIS
jgi:diphosphomevalonate decarboxylase